MRLTASVSQEGAYADVVVKLGLIKLLTKRFDVCEELYAFAYLFRAFWDRLLISIAFLYSDNAHSSLQCPIKPGEYTIEETVALPAEIPRGTSLRSR